MTVVQTRVFAEQVKRLNIAHKQSLDAAIKAVVVDPFIGDLKRGDLAGVRVYKLSMVDQQVLLAYVVDEQRQEIILMACGVHENFYRDLKRTL